MLRFAFNNDGLWGRPIRLGRLAATWLGTRLLNLVYPPRCIHCGSELPPDDDRRSLCSNCCLVLGPETWPGCRRCGAIVANGAVTRDHCPHCEGLRLQFDRRLPPRGIRWGVASGRAQDETDFARAFVGGHGSTPGPTARCSIRRVPTLRDHFHSDALRRRLWRGVNSPEILAQCLSHRLRVPTVRGALVRCRHTVPQHDLLPRERFENVRGAFRLRHRDRARWKDSHVLLVDDILTTGATCSEAARAFKEAGAAAVAVAVVAKAQGSQDP